MADYSATFAANTPCTLINSGGGTFALCTGRELRHEPKLRRIQRDARKRAKKTHLAGGDCCFEARRNRHCCR